jgi:hypothetical protein
MKLQNFEIASSIAFQSEGLFWDTTQFREIRGYPRWPNPDQSTRSPGQGKGK